ncbi:MAG: DUF3805 domain-containing protein [Acidobacteria bacterium]|nr:DUF3805 domain-containing protein [Acidobacteriota bacterium]
MTVDTRPASWFSLRYPVTWSLSEGTECTSLFDETNGSGALQISAYETDSNIDAVEALSEYLREEAVSYPDTCSSTVNGASMAIASYSKENFCTNVWVLSKECRLLLITYAREEGSDSEERALVKQILATLHLHSRPREILNGAK